VSIYSVSEITKHIKGFMDNDSTLRSVLIRGEISNFKCHYSGHCYFTLKDAGASIKAVMFKSKAQYLKFTPTNGMKIVASGYVTVFERDGQYQLYINDLFPEGVGELSLAFEQLKEKLTAEGLFDAIHKQSLPYFPKTIGIITSATGAVLRDIFTVSKRRNSNIELRIFPVQVQGIESAEQIVHAIEVFNTNYSVDVIIVGRGGGSMEDLWSFNDERVVRAIYHSKIPIVSAVGHETDFTLADFVSDVRAATPSQAAELIVPDTRELLRYIQNLQERLSNHVYTRLREKRSRLTVCSENKLLNNPQLILDQKRQQLDEQFEKLEQLKKNILVTKHHNLDILLEKLNLLNPLALVARGYSVVKLEEQVVRSVVSVTVGQNIEIVLSDGSIEAMVTKVKKGVGKRGARSK
jgi:exodeoxyribonuclease VII large subunit